MIKDVLLLGNKSLYEKSLECKKEDLNSILEVVTDLNDTLLEFRRKYGKGRAIAAPQIGILKRLIYLSTDKSYVLINPELSFSSNEQMEVLDDCMSFPDLLVRVKRYKKCHLTYRDLEWNLCHMDLEGDMSELIQHEYDHLNGILATMRAIDNKSFYVRKND